MRTLSDEELLEGKTLMFPPWHGLHMPDNDLRRRDQGSGSASA